MVRRNDRWEGIGVGRQYSSASSIWAASPTDFETYENQASFYSPDVCFEDAREYIPDISARRSFDVDLALSVLDQISSLIQPVDRSLYEDNEQIARMRVSRDPEDWPVAATALLLGLPIWTEDRDFFGSGIATWTTDRVELYLRDL